MTTLPAEKLTQLRQVIHAHVSQGGILEQIKACLTDALAQEGGRPLDEAALLRVLEERGLVDEVMKTVNLSSTMASPSPPHFPPHPSSFHLPDIHKTPDGRPPSPPHPEQTVAETRNSVAHATKPQDSTWPPCRPVCVPPATSALPLTIPSSSSSRRCLFVQVIGGRAFLDHLTDNTSCCHANFTLHLLFRGQRFFSSDVPCACEPDFKQEGFLFELDKYLRPPPISGRLISPMDCLSVSDPVQLALVRTNHRGEADLVGTCALAWRQVLCGGSGQISLSLELNGVGPEAKISPGILDIQVDLVPRPSESLVPELLSAQLEMERQQVSEKERLFLVYAKQWWKEYLSLRADHAHRLVKIFALDETGASRPVCSYVQPLRAGRLLDSPRHASRFVSLIPFEKSGSVGTRGCCSDVWTSCFSMLASRKGTCEDHACLLCSLLLGFGLEAWVCIGTKEEGCAHAWVMTSLQAGCVVFWESTTGQRYVQPTFDPSVQAGTPAPIPSHPYRTIGCMFNDHTFFANCQPSHDVSTISYELLNNALWKAMSSEAIRSVCGRVRRCVPLILPSNCDPSLAANEIEEQLRTLTCHHREEMGLTTVWDEDLCYLLGPALSSYETERCLGVEGIGSQEFQEAIHNAVPDGHTFKGFPLQVPHRNPRKLFHTCLQSPVCSEILACRGDQVNLAVRVKVYAYPENVCAVWVMFAIKYHSVL